MINVEPREEDEGRIEPAAAGDDVQDREASAPDRTVLFAETPALPLPPEPGRPPLGRPAATPGAFNPANLLTCAVLSLLAGGAGAWGYHALLERRQGAGGEPVKAEPPVADASTARLDDLAGRIEALRADLDARPSPQPPTDLTPLAERVSKLEGMSGAIESSARRLDELASGVDEDRRAVREGRESIEALRAQVAELRTASAAPRAANDAEGGSGPAAGRDEVVDLGPALDAFRQGKYAEASEAFQGLTRDHPEDARAWYLAALARGLATRDWKGETERLAREGADRERKGSPAKAEIDSSLEFLTTATGKDWIAYFRPKGS